MGEPRFNIFTPEWDPLQLTVEGRTGTAYLWYLNPSESIGAQKNGNCVLMVSERPVDPLTRLFFRPPHVLGSEGRDKDFPPKGIVRVEMGGNEDWRFRMVTFRGVFHGLVGRILEEAGYVPYREAMGDYIMSRTLE